MQTRMNPLELFLSWLVLEAATGTALGRTYSVGFQKYLWGHDAWWAGWNPWR